MVAASCFRTQAAHKAGQLLRLTKISSKKFAKEN
ncbi:hypothetical protein METH_09830 [Leisingera methylohalidivorans DSM 14336]|uniref:Uncharacterized protein n=1 Tax=Leisingera methylohalidivorans DSM 14336 TaxID=999552 RepID=V9W084_9RHOB|nr:hypothetical protein METH_09830 [Leisingera methylohalidivorans DSM 14336]